MFEGVGVAAVEPATVGVLDGLQRLGSLNRGASKIGKTNVSAFITIDMRIVIGKRADGHGCPCKARILELNERG